MAHNAKKMKLLVTGASGFIGYEVARQLSINGYRPRLMIREPGDDCEICHFDADFVLADLRNHRSRRIRRADRFLGQPVLAQGPPAAAGRPVLGVTAALKSQLGHLIFLAKL